MVIEPQDTVYYIYNNLIYKGVVQEQVDTTDSLFWYYRVQTHFGLQIMASYEIYKTIDRLVDSIMHESCYVVE